MRRYVPSVATSPWLVPSGNIAFGGVALRFRPAWLIAAGRGTPRLRLSSGWPLRLGSALRLPPRLGGAVGLAPPHTVRVAPFELWGQGSKGRAPVGRPRKHTPSARPIRGTRRVARDRRGESLPAVQNRAGGTRLDTPATFLVN
ncbi:MAG: hypothetical protein V3T28_00270, partial [Gemmatimonadales bacterium]